MKTRFSRQNLLHRAFQIGIFFKGLDGFTETAGGFLFLCFSKGAILRFVYFFSGHVLGDPDDWLARSLRHAFAGFSRGAKWFVGAYLLGHGIIKLLVVFGLWREKLWIFPFALFMLLAFIGYQVFRMFSHASAGLAFLTGLDVLIVALVWHEYSVKKKTTPSKGVTTLWDNLLSFWNVVTRWDKLK